MKHFDEKIKEANARREMYRNAQIDLMLDAALHGAHLPGKRIDQLECMARKADADAALYSRLRKAERTRRWHSEGEAMARLGIIAFILALIAVILTKS